MVGANGSGKTTLLRAGLGLVRLAAGEARLGGQVVGELSELRRAGLAAYLPQERRAVWNSFTTSSASEICASGRVK